MLFTFVGCRRVAARRVIHQARTFAGADFDHLIPDHTRQAQSKRFKPPRPAPPPGGATLFVRKNFQGIPVPNEARDASKVWMKNAQNSAKAFADINPPNKYSGRTVKVFGSSVPRALKLFDQLVQENGIRKTWIGQMRHQQRGALRRERHSRAWRRTFAHEIRQKIALVKHIRTKS